MKRFFNAANERARSTRITFGNYARDVNYVKSVLTWQKSGNKELISSLIYHDRANCQLSDVVLNKASRSPAISFVTVFPRQSFVKCGIILVKTKESFPQFHSNLLSSSLLNFFFHFYYFFFFLKFESSPFARFFKNNYSIENYSESSPRTCDCFIAIVIFITINKQSKVKFTTIGK